MMGYVVNIVDVTAVRVSDEADPEVVLLTTGTGVTRPEVLLGGK